MDPTTPAASPKTKPWLVPTVAVLLVIALGVLVWMFIQNSTSKTAEETPTVVVTLTDNGYDPATVKVKKGQDVTWKNQTSKAKQLVSDEGKPAGFATSEALAQGDTYTFTFDQTGTFHYHDPDNLGLKGTVIVE
jgi:plastocyanin